MKTIHITDANDPRIEVYTRLTDHQLRSRLDPSKARVIGESRLVIEAAIDTGIVPQSLLLDERHLASMKPVLDRLPEEVPVYVASRKTMSTITGFEVTRGYLCTLPRPAEAQVEDVLRGARRVAVLEGIVDVSNVGALFRSAAALGVDAVLVAPGCSDPLSRRALRVSMGCVLKVPWSRLPKPWPEAGIDLLHKKDFHCVALALRDDATVLGDPELAAHDRLALFLGTEGTGLSRQTIAACDECVIIPMSHNVDSLNVAAAAAIAFWELRVR